MATLHNEGWLRPRWEEGRTASDIAREAGSSVQAASAALRKLLGISKHPSPRRPEVLERHREKRVARALYPDAEPCVVCGEPGTRNHIDGNWRRHDRDNIEFLCMKHHLMVDKRLASWATRLVQEKFPELWREKHDDLLTEVRDSPDPYHHD